MLYKLCMFNRQRFHELRVHMGGWLQRRQGAHLFRQKTIASKFLPAGRTFLQMYIQLSDIYFAILQFPVCCKQYLCLDTIHASLTSCLYRLIKRSLARIKRIFTADALMFSISAISAQDRPSFSYSNKQTASLAANCLNPPPTSWRPATRPSNRRPQ